MSSRAKIKENNNERNKKLFCTAAQGASQFVKRYKFIHCEDSYIYCEQMPRLPRMGGIYDEKIPIYKWNKKTGLVTIFVICGKPGGVKGLDTGNFRSASKFDEDFLNVMSYRRFKKI